MAEMASSIAITIFDHSIGAVVRQFGYGWNHRKNLANLEAQVKKLDDVRDDKSHSVLVAQRNAERIRSQVENWQIDANKISDEARAIMEKYEDNAKNKCFMGMCPNIFSRYRLSRKACKKQREIIEAMAEANQFDRVADRAVHRVISTLSTEAYFAFDSRNSTLEEILRTLQDSTKHSIGVYGFGGMGKTTLVKQVATRAAEENFFDEIVVALVTQTPELKEIQGQIAKKLGLKLEETSVAERAGRIYERLKNKKVLIILDDLWEKLNLEEVGIPFDAKHMRCKLILTSRFLTILSSMDTEINFHLGALEEIEAWSLFEEKTKDVIKDPDFLSIGKEVAKRCAGLPVLIATVASSLSCRPSLPAWKDALNQLKKMNNREMHEFVNSAMEFISYKYLEETHKKLFLLCGLLGSGVSTARLLNYSWGWDLFDDAATMEEARNKLHALILDLKASCLLLDGDNEDTIKMHDVVRGVAISIARKDLHMFSTGDNGTELNRWPRDDVVKRCTGLVLNASSNLLCLPDRLECPSLELFILSGFSRDSSLTIPDTFFERTRKLKVLDMSGLSSPTLPPSISFLGSLQSLRLDYCDNLKDISIVGELKKLQVLSFVGSHIEELPRGIGQLSELRMLDLSHCYELNVIPAGLIEGLSQLEELYMSRSFNRWEAKGRPNGSGTSNVCLVELKCLPKLRSLEIEVPNAKLLSEDLDFENLERYTMIVGHMPISDIDYELDKKGISRKFGLQLETSSIYHLHLGVKRLIKRAESLCLRDLKGIKNIIQELDNDGFPKLKHLRIDIDSEIQYIVNVETEKHKAFPALESLELSDMLKLKKVCNGELTKESFCKLTSVDVRGCHRLESLFSFSMAINLPCLEEIQVSNCNILKGIVAERSGEDGNVNTNDAVSEKIEFVQLHKLFIECLPQLINFYSGVKTTTDVQSEELFSEDEEKPEFSMPFFDMVSFPRLEELTLSEISNLRCMWSKNHREIFGFRNLQKLTVEKCGSLKYLFTPSITTGLVRLQRLIVKNCMMMKKIVAKEKGKTTIDTIIFPHLSYLCIEDLPSLTTFYSGDEEMGSNENSHTAAQPLFNEKANFPSLERLEISNMNNIKSIWHNQLYDEDTFCKLGEVRVEQCAKLLKIFPSTMLGKLQSLKEVMISDCGSLEEVFDVQDGPSLKEITNDITTVWQLSRLYLSDLPKLRFVWKRDLHKILSFQNLSVVSVYRCHSLKHIFPFAVAQCLHRLERLCMGDCKEVQTIVVDDFENKGVVKKIKEEEEEEMSTTFKFPKLTDLDLRNLPKMECFYPMKHTSEWPVLKWLHANDCDKLSVLELLNISEIHGQNQFEKLLSNLEKLTIKSKDMNMITRQYGHLPSELFLNLTWLIISEFQNDESATFPSEFICKFHNLKKLSVHDSLFSEIFPCELVNGIQEVNHTEHTILLPHLTFLGLRNLPELKCIWKQDSLLIPLLEKLDWLFVKECPRLTYIVPGSISFEFLERLIVHNCGGLMKLIQSSTATSLKKLEWLEIVGCQMIEEIVACDGDGDDIIFSRLWRIELRDLPRLTKFCPGNFAFKFPSLQIVRVTQCPKMRTFSRGTTVTPILEDVKFKSENRWNGDLNTTIQHFFLEMETQRLTTADPSTLSSNQHSESAANEVEEFYEESTKQREEGQTEKTIEPREEIGGFGQPDDPIGQKVDICGEATKPGKGKEKIEISEEMVPSHSYPSSLSPANEAVKQTNTGSLAPRDVVASSSLLSPASNRPETSLSLITEAGTSRAASNSQQWDFQGLRVRKEFITLLSEFLQIYQTEPLNSMSAQQVQFMVNAFRDLSSTNFSIEWFSPYVEKARERLSVVEREKEIFELEIKISEAEAHLRSLKDRKKTLEEKNEAFTSSLDLDN